MCGHAVVEGREAPRALRCDHSKTLEDVTIRPRVAWKTIRIASCKTVGVGLAALVVHTAILLIREYLRVATPGIVWADLLFLVLTRALIMLLLKLMLAPLPIAGGVDTRGLWEPRQERAAEGVNGTCVDRLAGVESAFCSRRSIRQEERDAKPHHHHHFFIEFLFPHIYMDMFMYMNMLCADARPGGCSLCVCVLCVCDDRRT